MNCENYWMKNIERNFSCFCQLCLPWADSIRLEVNQAFCLLKLFRDLAGYFFSLLSCYKYSLKCNIFSRNLTCLSMGTIPSGEYIPALSILSYYFQRLNNNSCNKWKLFNIFTLWIVFLSWIFMLIIKDNPPNIKSWILWHVKSVWKHTILQKL